MEYTYRDKLASERLITRFLTEKDMKAWEEFFEDKDATMFFPEDGLTSGNERSKRWIERQMQRYEDKRFGLQALIEKNTKEFVGQCGLITQEVEGKTELEVGYHIFKKHWGRGYAPEAAKLFIDFAFKNNLASSIISIIDTRNINSQRVADKNGLMREKEIRWMGLQVYIYRISGENRP